jgi:hypothetical protein
MADGRGQWAKKEQGQERLHKKSNPTHGRSCEKID